MTSFLGVPIRCHDQSFGHLSLANKATPQGLVDGFSELDEQIVSTLPLRLVRLFRIYNSYTILKNRLPTTP